MDTYKVLFIIALFAINLIVKNKKVVRYILFLAPLALNVEGLSKLQSFDVVFLLPLFMYYVFLIFRSHKFDKTFSIFLLVSISLQINSMLYIVIYFLLSYMAVFKERITYTKYKFTLFKIILLILSTTFYLLSFETFKLDSSTIVNFEYYNYYIFFFISFIIFEYLNLNFLNIEKQSTELIYRIFGLILLRSSLEFIFEYSELNVLLLLDKVFIVVILVNVIESLLVLRSKEVEFNGQVYFSYLVFFYLYTGPGFDIFLIILNIYFLEIFLSEQINKTNPISKYLAYSYKLAPLSLGFFTFLFVSSEIYKKTKSYSIIGLLLLIVLIRNVKVSQTGKV
ncbi:MAG: hypothetical protein ACI9QD_000672 [Thermoproteota archaeon]|jgi:hypothetical protein